MHMLLVATIAGALTATPVKDAPQCQPEFVAQGAMAGPAQSDAELVARVYWRNQVSRTYGSQYADWNNARNARIECIRLNSDTYQCWATATPCLSGRLILE